MTAPAIDTCPYGPLRDCAACREPMHPGTTHKLCPNGHPTHRGRGLDMTCYEVATRDGTLIDYPRTSYPRDELLEEWSVLSERGVDYYEFPQVVGMSFETWARAFQRARRAGHPLAVRRDR